MTQQEHRSSMKGARNSPSRARRKAQKEGPTIRGAAEVPPGPAGPVPVFSGFSPFSRAFLVVLAAGCALRLCLLTREGYWADEVWVYYDCLNPLPTMVKRIHFLHFLLGKAFLSVWDSIGALRLMTALWGVATFPFLYDLGARLMSRRAGLLATVFLAFSSYHVHYSLDANYYAPVMFCATAGLWFGVRYLAHAHPLDFLLCLVVLMGGFLYHPFSGVFLASVGGLLSARALTSRRHRMWMWPGQWRRAGRPGAAMLLSVAELALVAGLIAFAALRMRSVLSTLFSWLELGATPRNYRFIPTLFYDYFRGNLADYPQASRLSMSLAWPAVVIAGLGLAAAARRRSWAAALLFAPLVVSFLLIANLKAQHHFYIRYFSYCYPGLVLLLVWGCEQLGLWIAPRPPPANGAEPDFLMKTGKTGGLLALVLVYVAGIGLALFLGWSRFAPLQSLAWVLGLLAFAAVPLGGRFGPQALRKNLSLVLIALLALVGVWTMGRRFLIQGGGNLSEAAAVLRKQAGPNDLLLWKYFPEWDMLRYYLPRIGFPERNTIKVPEGEDAGEMRVAQLKAFSRFFPSFWILRCWNVDDNPSMIRWASRYLETSADAPSNFEPLMDVHLFHGNLVGRFLDHPYGVRIAYQDDERASQGGAPFQGVAWERQVEVEDATTVSLRLLNPEVFPPEGLRVRALVDGSASAWFEPSGVSPAVEIPAGSRRLGVEIQVSAPVSQPPAALWSALNLASGVRFPASCVSLPYPSFCHADTYQGRPALRLARNLGVQYWFDFPAAGTYELRIEAVHDKPRPVLLDVAVDETFQGMVGFERMDNSWGEQALPIRMDSPGWHSLAINLVSAGEAKWGLAEDEETNAILGELALRHMREGESARDDRLALGPQGAREPRTISIPLVGDTDGKALPGWVVQGQTSSIQAVSRRPVALREEPAVEVEIPPHAQSAQLIGPLRPCPKPGGTVHAQATLGAFDLINHSVSLGLLFFDDQNRTLLASASIGQEAIFRTTDGHRFVVVRSVPQGAASYAPLVIVYQNGQRPSKRPGWIRMGGVAVAED